MSHRYAPLPNPRSDQQAHSEMEAAFDDSDDENDHITTSESQPLNPSPPTPVHTHWQPPGTYDFENVDYDYPPPGSPPAPSSIALPNDHGNSNGVIPSFSINSAVPGPHRGWFKRSAASLLPSGLSQRLGLVPRPIGVVGGGLQNDGVFANVTAKPSRPVPATEGDATYLVPEETRADAPPSYAHAQADAVPPYWETTVHAPFSSDGVGEMIVDSLATGTLFSFLWNMLISISFQFVGFLLTYLLHTTHAARLGSRAGLGVTLIQYGFSIRNKVGGTQDSLGGWRVGDAPDVTPTMESAAEANEYYKSLHNGTTIFDDSQTNALVAAAATEWLSFFLMTIGWFILLTSLLGFWRVKRWERGIISSQRDNALPAASTSQPPPSTVLSQFDTIFNLNSGSHGALLRQGFGFGSTRTENREREYEWNESNDRLDLAERALMIPGNSADPNRDPQIQEALQNERRLQHDLRAAGLI